MHTITGSLSPSAFNTLTLNLSCCRSSIGQTYPRRRSLWCFLLCLLFSISAAGLIVSECRHDCSFLSNFLCFSYYCFSSSVIFLCLNNSFSLQAGTWSKAQVYGGIYAAWVAMLLLVVVTLARALYWTCLRVSQPLQNFT